MANLRSTLLRGMSLSATEIKSLTDWPGVLVEDYLSIIENLLKIVDLIDRIVIEDAIYFGGKDTDGTWRITLDGDDLKFQVRQSGTYEDASTWAEADLSLNNDVIRPTNTTASRIVATDATKKLVSVTNLALWLLETTNQVLVDDNGNGTVTLRLPQDIAPTSSPTFDDLTLTGSIFLDDNETVTLGTGSDSTIKYDGTDLWIDPAVVGSGSVKIGDGTNYTEIQDDGTLIYVGTAHNLYGSMYIDDGAQAVTISVADTYYEIGGGFSDGGNDGFTLQNSKELKCLVAGKYKVDWAITIQNANSDRTVAGGIMVNTTEQHNTENATRTKENGVDYAVGGSGIIDLAVDDVVKIMVNDYTGTGTLTVTHANMCLTQVGG